MEIVHTTTVHTTLDKIKKNNKEKVSTIQMKCLFEL